MERSYKPVACGSRVTLMSPLGSYPAQGIVLDDVAFIVGTHICFSVARIIKEEWNYGEVDRLSPLDIPLLGSLLLSRIGRPYPVTSILLETATREPLNSDCLAECRQHLLHSLNECDSLTNRPAFAVHMPPACGGHPYEMYDFGDASGAVSGCFDRLKSADAVLLRGVGALLKAEMAWTHGEFGDAACIFLWIALDAAYHLTTRKLRESGVVRPTAEDASAHFNSVIGFETPWSKFWEADFDVRNTVMHPVNRIAVAARPLIEEDDYYELRHLLIPYFRYLATGVFVGPDANP